MSEEIKVSHPTITLEQVKQFKDFEECLFHDASVYKMDKLGYRMDQMVVQLCNEKRRLIARLEYEHAISPITLRMPI